VEADLLRAVGKARRICGDPLDGRLWKGHWSSPLLSIDSWDEWYAANRSNGWQSGYTTNSIPIPQSNPASHRAGFLIRNAITLRMVTNKAQEAYEESFELISFLCFNRRNSQLSDGTVDFVCSHKSLMQRNLTGVAVLSRWQDDDLYWLFLLRPRGGPLWYVDRLISLEIRTWRILILCQSRSAQVRIGARLLSAKTVLPAIKTLCLA